MTIFNQIPDIDNFLEVWLEQGEIVEKIQDFKKSNDACILFYDVSSIDIGALMPTIHARSVELSDKLKKQNILHDILLKPIFLFEKKSCAEFFADFLDSCNEEELCEVVSELQLEHNEPWRTVDLLTDKQTRDIVAYYLARFVE